MYKYRLVEQEEKVSKFHQERVDAFDKIEARLDNIKKSLRQAKIETIKYYRENFKLDDNSHTQRLLLLLAVLLAARNLVANANGNALRLASDAHVARQLRGRRRG